MALALKYIPKHAIAKTCGDKRLQSLLAGVGTFLIVMKTLVVFCLKMEMMMKTS
jgi:hypothetical protein